VSLRRILITGGAGFLGSHLTERFRRAGVQVRLFDVAECPSWAHEPDIDYVRGDVCDQAAVAAALHGIDAVIHAAFASPYQSAAGIRRVNVDGTRILCAESFAAGRPRLILLSSTIVSRPPKVHPFLRNAPLTRLDLYRASRAEAERVVSEFGSKGLSTAIVRPKTFLGPGRVSAFALLFERIRLGQPAPVLGSGQNRYQMLDIRDMAAGICLLAEAHADGIFFFGARDFFTVREDLQALLNHAQTGSRLQFIPGPLARMALRGMELVNLMPLSEWHYMSARGADSVVDISRAEQELGWRPEKSNAQALIEAYDWRLASVAATGAARTTHPVPPAHRGLNRLSRIFLQKR
jgi:nucleoside-diphosphate-sugar epimerase